MNNEMKTKPDNARIDFDAGCMLSPVPVVMLSCQSKDLRPNIITLAWAGTVNSDPPMISVSIRKSRYSYEMVRESGEFVVNLVSQKLAKACDYCGVKSGRDLDKFQELGLHAEAMPKLEIAPGIAESPLSLGCIVRQEIDLPSHQVFIGEVVSTRVDPKLLNENGSLELFRAGLISYVHGEYYAHGDWLGFFGYSVARPEILEKRSRGKQGNTGSGIIG